MTRIVELREGVLRKNDLLARELRRRFEDASVLVVNVVSSPGAGKTELLARSLERLLESGCTAAAITGDVATDNDQKRLSASGARVRQIQTHGVCHLDAEMIGNEVGALGLEGLDVLFIENVGNLVCPASYDLGETVRIALLSVTEGEDKPVKYPTLFNSADVGVITKIDLAKACEFDREAAYTSLSRIRPGMRVFETSARTGAGMEAWLDYLVEQRTRARPVATGENYVSGRSG